MKTYEIKDLLKKELLIVELPKWYKNFNYQKPLLEVRGNEPNLVEFLSFGRYTLLGKPNEIREEDAKELVEKVMNGQHFQNYKGRKENDFSNLWCKTATESLLSALESEIYWDNPYGDRMPIFVEASPSAFKFVEKEKERWQEAQEKTFDKNRSIILFKN